MPQSGSGQDRLERLASAAGQRIRGEELRMRCPVHAGAENPTSLALWIDRHGNPDRIAAYCHAQLCGYADIAKAVLDLFGIELNPSSEARYEVARWDYRNTKGETVYAVRWNITGKDYKSKVTRDPRGVRGPFFVRLYNDRGDGPVVLCEGEKAAQAVADAGMTAASYLGGAKQAGKAVYSPVQGRDVVIWADDDREGRDAASAAARALQGIAASIRAVDMPGEESHADAADFPGETRRAMVAAALSFMPPSAEVNEYELPIVEKSAAGLAEALEGLNYQIRWNTRAKREEYRNGNGSGWQPFDDLFMYKLVDRVAANYRVVNSVGARVRFEMGKDTFARYSGPIFYDRQVDAFQADYIDQLPPWDEVHRVNTVLQDLFGCDDTPLVQAVNRLIFGMVVMRIFTPGLKSDVTPVLRGAQGWGKSAFVRNLLPPGEMGDDWYSDGLDFHADAKMMVEATDGKVIVEWGEMSSLSGNAMAQAKSWLTRTNDNSIRRAFGRYPPASARRFIVVATTDKDSPLPADPAGNRRFVVVELRRAANVESWFNETGVSSLRPKVNRRDLLWAEALAKIRSGQDWRFSRALLEAQAEINEEYRPVDELLDPLLEELETPENASAGLKLTEVRAHVLQSDPDNSFLSRAANNDNRLKDALLTRKWRRGTGRDRRVWFPPGNDGLFGDAL